jgi:hypothetical protein
MREGATLRSAPSLIRESSDLFFKIPPADSRSIYSNETNVCGTALDSPVNQNPSIALATPVEINRYSFPPIP